MSVTVNAIPSIVAAQGAARDVALQPGSAVAARVLEVSANNQARISIAGQTIDVTTQVPLQVGQTLQLAVSQTADGIRLAVLPQQAAATSTSDLTATLLTTLAASKAQLTAPEAVAVSQAALGAVTKQTSLSALFANLGAATSLDNLPPKLQQAIAQVLAQRPPLDARLTGGELKTAFQNSGLFLEASLAQSPAASGAMPDMKAALVVLKQALTTTLASETAGKPAVAAPTTSQPAPGQTQATAVPMTTAAQVQAAAATLVPGMLPKSAVKNDTAQAPASAVSEEGAEADIRPHLAAATAKATAALVSGGAQQSGAKIAEMIAKLLPDESALLQQASSVKGQPGALYVDAQAQRAPLPPPPLRGALPTPQPMAQATLASNAPLGETVQHLLADTDAAIARQTLHQIASLPERVDAVVAQRMDQATPRWSFEIPFVMPQGTAIAQFEISRDGGQGSETEAAKQVWCARFSLDVEPTGPIHAVVSLTGEKTSVRMWAERSSTAAQLKAETGQLTQALIRANLRPGDIVVREGAPQQQVAPASAGHFLDMAL